MCGACFPDVFIHHSPNGSKLPGSLRDRQVAGGILKGDGVKAGFPDLIFVWRGGIAFIEVKRPKNSTLSVEQRAVHEILRNMGWAVGIAKSADDAHAFLKDCGAPCKGELL